MRILDSQVAIFSFLWLNKPISLFIELCKTLIISDSFTCDSFWRAAWQSRSLPWICCIILDHSSTANASLKPTVKICSFNRLAAEAWKSKIFVKSFFVLLNKGDWMLKLTASAYLSFRAEYKSIISTTFSTALSNSSLFCVRFKHNYPMLMMS